MKKKIKHAAIGASIAAAFGAISMLALLGVIGERIYKKNNLEAEGDDNVEDIACAIMDAAGGISRD